ncbi:MAG TPA: hypothetical protein VHI52_15980, partial [Verrucomicrobiae bacterium]|nr:hypothetical protein [Verrucomicrobiae bacterium]
PGDAADLDQPGLQALISSNSTALHLLRMGLGRRCVVPTDTAPVNLAQSSRDLIHLKSLAMLLRAEGRLAEMEHRNADAARSYVEAIGVGTAMSRGGMLINRMVGIACEGIGCLALVKLLPELQCEEMRPLVRELEELDAGTVKWEEVVQAENRFVRSQVGAYPNPIKLGWDIWQARKMRQTSLTRHQMAAAHLRLLFTEMALRCYRCDHGSKAPEGLALLSASYLRATPQDPFTQRNLAYLPQGTNWLLYSFGPDRVDDGGRPARRMEPNDFLIAMGGQNAAALQPKGDVRYDSPW